MVFDPDDPLIRQLNASIRSNPRLANPSGYTKVFASILNDRQPDSEKNTPETEWRRMRDLEAKLNRLGKALMLMVGELERDGQLNITVEEKLGSVPEPTDDNYDPISGPAARGGRGSSGVPVGIIDIPAGIRAIREGVAEAREVAEAALAGGGGGGVTDHGALTGLTPDDDHPQYILVAGTRAFTGDQSMGTHKLTSLTAGAAGSDAVNKTQMDAGDALAIPKSLVTTKGDVITTTAASTPARRGVGANGTTLIANSANADGWMIGDHGDLAGNGDDDHTIYTKADGTRAFTGDQSMGSHKLTSVTNPSNPQDAATKAYVDSTVITDHGGLGGLADDDHTQYILVAGTRAFTGDQSMGTHKITNLQAPAAANDAARKTDVDTLEGLVIKKDGSVAFTGTQSMGTHQISNVLDPSNPQDAATKNYVDSFISVPTANSAAQYAWNGI